MIKSHEMGKNYCVYVHKKKTDSTPFYIGISGNRNRPYNFEDRTDLHKRIAQKYGAMVEILAEDLTFKEAVTIEAEMIQTIGRRCDGTGPLANFKAHHFEHYEATKHRKKLLPPKKKKRAKKQPKNASTSLQSAVLMMYDQYSIRQIAKKLSIPATLVRKLVA